jgi:hypothetical protein
VAARNDTADAELLWDDWRTCLVKRGVPGDGVGVTHGQSHLHWQRAGDGMLVLNLEDVERDYDESVTAFVAALERDSERRAVALRRVDEKPIHFEVRDVQIGGAASVSATGTTISVSYTVEIPPRDDPSQDEL